MVAVPPIAHQLGLCSRKVANELGLYCPFNLPVVSGKLPLLAVAMGHGRKDEGDEGVDLHVDSLFVTSYLPLIVEARGQR